jgi:hypothetical protein
LWNYIVSYTISMTHFKAWDERWTKLSSFRIVLEIIKDVMRQWSIFFWDCIWNTKRCSEPWKSNSYQFTWIGNWFLETTNSGIVLHWRKLEWRSYWTSKWKHTQNLWAYLFISQNHIFRFYFIPDHHHTNEQQVKTIEYSNTRLNICYEIVLSRCF